MIESRRPVTSSTSTIEKCSALGAVLPCLGRAHRCRGVCPGRRRCTWDFRTPEVVTTPRALLRCEFCGDAEEPDRVSDRSGEFGERRGDPQPVAGVDAEFVVSAAQFLDEGVAGDHHLGSPISL